MMAIDSVRTIDYHTGGEPFRIVAAPACRHHR